MLSLGNLAAYDQSLVLYVRQRIRPDETGGCWRWLGGIRPYTSKGAGGYAQINSRGGGYYGRVAHRLIWEMINGPVPAGLELDHTCRNRPCVNPGHLEPVRHAENIRRGLFAKYERLYKGAPA